MAIRRRLAAARPDDLLPELAGYLVNLSVVLTDLGRREEALGASEDALRSLLPGLERRPGAYDDTASKQQSARVPHRRRVSS